MVFLQLLLLRAGASKQGDRHQDEGDDRQQEGHEGGRDRDSADPRHLRYRAARGRVCRLDTLPGNRAPACIRLFRDSVE